MLYACWSVWAEQFFVILVILVIFNCFLIKHSVGNILVYIYLGKVEDFLQSDS